MKKTIYKAFWAWDFDKEEAWLNDMAAKGLSLVSVSGFKYLFEETIPGEYAIRLELLENLPTHPESAQYIKFLEETGAEHLDSVIRWVYFRKKKTDGSFDLFSDYDSRIKHIARVQALLSVLMVVVLALAIFNLLWYGNADPDRLAYSLGFNLGTGVINLTLSILLGCGLIKLYNKKKKLKKERQLFE